MGRYRSVVLAIVASSVWGCASITSTETQSLALTTKTLEDQDVKGVKCSARNDKGAWEANSPGYITVRRSAEDLMVECKKEGFADGVLRAVSRAAGGMWGNILFGGGIGAIVDHTNGKGYNYPDSLPVKMGTSTIVDRKEQQTQQQPSPSLGSSATP